MTTKLTLTIDDSVIHSAKKYAAANKRSVSDMVENYLKTLTTNKIEEDSIAPEVRKLRGILKVSKDFDYKKELQNEIIKKHMK
jgi:hypothetical protein